MENRLETLIVKALENYNYQNNKFKEERFLDENSTLTFRENKFSSKNKIFSYELLATFDDKSKTWIWSWCSLILPSNLCIESKYLLQYGLQIENSTKDVGSGDVYTLDNSQYFLKLLLCNSRLKIENELQLDLIMAICSYLLNKRIDFVFKSEKKSSERNIYNIYIAKLEN